MELIVTGRHVSVTEPMKRYAREKLERVVRGRPHLNEARLVMDVEKYRHRAEITVRGKNLEIFCREETPDMYASIDGVLEKLERQLRRYRERHSRKAQKHQELLRAEEAPRSEAAPPEPVIAQRIAMRPMFLREALLKMRVEGHLFLAFLDGDTNEVNLLYRANGGEVAHLTPKKLRGPEKEGKFRVRFYSEESIAPDGKPRLLRKDVVSVPWVEPEDALLRMRHSGETFRLFLNRETETPCVIFRQADGNYAIVEPLA